MKTQQTTHTPGPWIIGTRDLSDNTIPITFEGKLSPVAYVSPRPFYEDTQEANARLIAAAPELLTMLEDVQAWLETQLELGNINAGTANRDGDLVSQIRSAIAKATGGDK